MISQGFLGQPIQRSGLNVLLQLLVPFGHVELFEPGPELSAARGIQLLHGSFDGMEADHGRHFKWPAGSLMRTLSISHVPDEVAARLEKLADNAELLNALPSLPIERDSILEALAESRAGR